MDMTSECYRIAVEQRIADLWRYRTWWRAHRWAEYPLQRQETDVELRALVRLARRARKAARRAQENHENASRRLYEEWTESEKAVAWGR